MLAGLQYVPPQHNAYVGRRCGLQASTEPAHCLKHTARTSSFSLFFSSQFLTAFTRPLVGVQGANAVRFGEFAKALYVGCADHNLRTYAAPPGEAAEGTAEEAAA